MIILGANFGRDSSVCLVDTEQRKIAALSTERVTRLKHDDANVSVAIAHLPHKKPDLIAHALPAVDGREFALSETPVQCFDHHLCHAASAYHTSPFYRRPALILTLDSRGEKAFLFTDTQHQEIPLPLTPELSDGRAVSLGKLYAAFTEAAGFYKNSEEGKTEALAAFGNPVPSILHDLHQTYRAEQPAPFYDLDYLRALAEQHGKNDFCATIQQFLEELIVNAVNALSLPPEIDCLGLAGGVTANIVMNLALYEKTRFKNIHIAPFMGNEGTAYGAAMLAARRVDADIAWTSLQHTPYFGPAYSRDEVQSALQRRSGSFSFTEIGENWPAVAAKEVAEGGIVALFHGQAEFGPRALGNRSIVANPADPSIRERLNLSIKRRPSWQPFCPSILESERTRLFTDSFSHKHMAIAFRMKPEFASQLPSAVHADNTARPQFVSPEDNPFYYRFLEEVKRHTGFGVALNTSFNLHGRAMVLTPDNALDDFLACNLDTLFIEGFRVRTCS